MILDTRKAAHYSGCSEAMYLFLLSKVLNNNTEGLFTIAKNNNYIDKEGNITEEIKETLTKASFLSLPDAISMSTAQTQAKALMSIWPGGIKPGTTSSWRGTLKQNTLRLIQFTSLFGHYTLPDMIKAANTYIKSFADPLYMKTLPNFIIQEEVLSEEHDKVVSVPTSLLEQYIILTSEDNDNDKQ